MDPLKQTIADVRHSDKLEISFLAQGAFNKLYDLQIDDETFAIRVSLPVDPRWKTLSEVATIRWKHMVEFEQTQLRKHFIAEMQRNSPDWMEVFHCNEARRDSDLAVRYCDNEILARSINQWLDKAAGGNDHICSLNARIGY